jgi:hypothetical protein
LALKWLVEVNKPEVIFIQETMGKGDTIVRDMKKSFVGWEFLALDAKGFSGGLITGWSQNISLINSFVVCSGLCIEVFSKSLGMELTLLNVYGPYEGKQTFLD